MCGHFCKGMSVMCCHFCKGLSVMCGHFCKGLSVMCGHFCKGLSDWSLCFSNRSPAVEVPAWSSPLATVPTRVPTLDTFTVCPPSPTAQVIYTRAASFAPTVTTFVL